jgi:hypothetical protein
MKDQPDIRLLVRWLGTHGAKSGLLDSKLWSVDVLKGTAAELGLKVADKISRKELVEEVVRAANKRIHKSLDELYSMDVARLAEYLNDVGVEVEELLELLKELDVTPRREGLKNLIDFTARELSETGRFMRIAGKKPDPNLNTRRE